MDVEWVHTPSDSWLCLSERYRGIIMQVESGWLARIEDDQLIYPGDTVFGELRVAKAWVEEKLQELRREHKEEQ